MIAPDSLKRIAAWSRELNEREIDIARAGIVEYWVLDIAGRRMFVHREPRGGHYAAVVAYNCEESVAPLCAPESPFLVKNAFPV